MLFLRRFRYGFPCVERVLNKLKAGIRFNLRPRFFVFIILLYPFGRMPLTQVLLGPTTFCRRDIIYLPVMWGPHSSKDRTWTYF